MRSDIVLVASRNGGFPDPTPRWPTRRSVDGRLVRGDTPVLDTLAIRGASPMAALSSAPSTTHEGRAPLPVANICFSPA